MLWAAASETIFLLKFAFSFLTLMSSHNTDLTILLIQSKVNSEWEKCLLGKHCFQPEFCLFSMMLWSSQSCDSYCYQEEAKRKKMALTLQPVRVAKRLTMSDASWITGVSGKTGHLNECCGEAFSFAVTTCENVTKKAAQKHWKERCFHGWNKENTHKSALLLFQFGLRGIQLHECLKAQS